MARRSKAESNSILYHLPEEILIQILVRLPVKSLLRFKSVCKQWYSLIVEPSFIQTHLRTSSQNSYIILSSTESQFPIIDSLYSIRYDNESFDEYFQPQLPSHLKQSLRMQGSCNGLIFLSNDRTICLWNPALRTLKTLPNSLIMEPNSHNSKTDRANLAFEFLPGVNDYKVVRILRFWEGDIRIPTITRAEVYSLSTDSWRIIDVPPSYYFNDQLPAIGNGAAYWVAMKRTDEVFCCLLVRFDMGGEVFEDVMLPNAAKNCYSRIAIMEESLYLFLFHSNECGHLWTMECANMGSWTVRFTLNFQDKPFKILALRKSGELLQLNHKGHLVSYNFETRRAKDLGIHGQLFSAYSYMESFIQ